MSHEQLSLFAIAPLQKTFAPQHDPYWDEIVKADTPDLQTPCECVGAQVKPDTQKVAPQHDTHWVERYWVERATNKYWYYRYCWMVGRKKNRLYIGSVSSRKAQHKKQTVEDAIADGQTPGEIKQLLKLFKS